MSADAERADPPEPTRQPQRRRRPLGRFLAPLALILVAVALVVIVSRARSHDGTAAVSNTVTTGHTHRSPKSKPGRKSTKHGRTSSRATTSTTGTSSSGTDTSTVGTYTVESGDSFGAISSKTGVPVATLEQLNPGTSSTSLRVGQVLKLK